MGKWDSFLTKIGFTAEETVEQEEDEDNETYKEPKSATYSSSAQFRTSRGASGVKLSSDNDPEEVTREREKEAERVTSYRSRRPAVRDTRESSLSVSQTGPKVVNLHASVQMEVVVSSPESFEEARSISDDLKNNKPVVINLEFVEHPIAQRITDFLCGACYAMGGNIQQIADKIYMIAPGNVDIAASTDFRKTLQNEGGLVFPWSSDTQ